MKDELGEKNTTKHVGSRAKTYSYIIHDDSEDEKAKDTKKCVVKRRNLNLRIIKLFRSNSN